MSLRETPSVFGLVGVRLVAYAKLIFVQENVQLTGLLQVTLSIRYSFSKQ